MIFIKEQKKIYNSHRDTNYELLVSKILLYLMNSSIGNLKIKRETN